ncbi:hypothetical protein, partial [Lysobacter sp. 22409]|uniref:hypothetical protein n=1 Tax=Lysobacter sp. 22409 TaxID=3453917 RepID=UPI003F86F6ED
LSPGFFDRTSLSYRKTAHVLCAALRVFIWRQGEKPKQGKNTATATASRPRKVLVPADDRG